MTAASAMARGFTQLTAARIGVGVGEASASPAAFSLLSDYFPPARRATVLAIYSSGIYIGAGLGLFIGGLIVERWDLAYAAGAAPLGLRGWQVAFLAVGSAGRSPGAVGLDAARAAARPERGTRRDGLSMSARCRRFLHELRAVIPPFTFLHLWLLGGARALRTNVAAARSSRSSPPG